MPIEELSRRTGVTVRNLRELQTKGLLHPPTLVGRKGHYTKRHLGRVVLVRNLQDRGYSIAAISDLLDRWKGTLGPLGVEHLEAGVSAPSLPEPRRLTEREIFELLPELRTHARLRAQARATELVHEDEHGKLVAPSAELVETARALADIGIPLDVQLKDLRLLRDEIDVMASRFRQRFQQHVVSKLQASGMDGNALEDMAKRLVTLRPAVVRGVAVVLSAALDKGGPPEARKPKPR
jgi:DNA-binding transcriptional MerR regulator